MSLTVVVAPDSFKGSLTAREVADAMAAGARRALGEAATVRTVPMADGGEGAAPAGLTGAFSIARGPATEVELTASAGELVADAAETACRLLAHGRQQRDR